VAGPIIQNFSIPADNDVELDFTLLPTSGVALGPGTEILFSVYESEFGAPVAGVPAVLSKTLDHGIQITDPDTKQFTVTVARADTVALLRNYYYEVTVVDVNGDATTTTVGILTITGTENRV